MEYPSTASLPSGPCATVNAPSPFFLLASSIRLAVLKDGLLSSVSLCSSTSDRVFVSFGSGHANRMAIPPNTALGGAEDMKHLLQAEKNSANQAKLEYLTSPTGQQSNIIFSTIVDWPWS